MKERDINGTLVMLKGIAEESLKKQGAHLSERLAAESALTLLGTLLVDINRIADALEVIAHEARQPKD